MFENNTQQNFAKRTIMLHCKKTASRTNGTFGFARHPDSYRDRPFAKPKEPFFCQRTDNNDDINSLENMRN